MTRVSSPKSAPSSRTVVESEISRAIVRFEKESLGRGPLETKTYLLDDMIVVRLKGVLTAAERKLAHTGSERSVALIKQLRNELLASTRPLLEALVRDIVGVPVLSVHADVCVKTAERIIVMTLDRAPQLEGPDTA